MSTLAPLLYCEQQMERSQRQQKRSRRSLAPAPSPALEILRRSELWRDEPRAEAVLRQAIGAAAQMLASQQGELAVVLTDDSEIRVLNKKWRCRNKATDVLSFPAEARQSDRRTPRLLGDIVLSFETAARDACAQNKKFLDHIAHLAVHGFLHLLGYDHARRHDAERMERLEIAILAKLGIANPYAADGARSDC